MLTFSLRCKKLKKADLSRARGHNLREHDTDSQLPPEAWHHPQGVFGTEWDDDKAKRAVDLAKRKDAVVGVELVFQVGNQRDWRERPTKEHKHGKVKKPDVDFSAMTKAIRKYLADEFGADNVVCLNLHMDETTPHFHAVVTPIKDGKLQAKHWMDGPVKMSKLRQRAFAAVSAAVPCQYNPEGKGGKPHDPTMAAGGINSPLVTEIIEENEALRSEVSRLMVDVQRLEQFKALRDELDATSDALDGLRRENGLLRGRIKEIEAEALKTAPTSVQKAVFRVPKGPGF